jgi:uncharacterized protein (DUF885 family)
MRFLPAAVIVLLIPSGIAAHPASQASIDDFFRDFTADWMRHDPSFATATRYFTGDEQDRLERPLTPQTLAWKRDRMQRAKRGLVELSEFDRAQMNDTQRVSADLLQWQLKDDVEEGQFLDYEFPLSQLGDNVYLVSTLTVVHPLRTDRDAENYVAALGQVSTRMDELIAESKRLAAKGVLPPRFILQAAIKQMQTFILPPPGENAFVGAFARKMEAIKTMPEAKREELRAQAEKIVATQVYPAWQRASTLLQSQLPHATQDAGLWRLKGGSNAYAYFIHSDTTTNLTPEQIHEIGLKRVGEIEAQMDGLLRQLGRTEGSVKDRIEKLQADLQYPDPTSDASRTQIMQDIEGILRDGERRSALPFDIRPKSPVIAQPYPRFLEDASAASYSAPAPDGSRPGTFQYPLRLSQMTKFGLRSVVYHEAVPGHHFQIALQVENAALPRFRQIGAFGRNGAYVEGWGLYAERLAAESGWYDGDPEGLLGQLNYELFRARRLVVDTGLHAMHWTQQQAIDYGIEPSEVERYVVWPGQACSYMVGELKIIELREKAKRTLGDKFSLREFHNAILRPGDVSFDVLERQVDAYIKSAGGTP